ncbi:MAG: His/Gly/Thr/Pro-type tRNA ligase C-terminal domain-containing protein [Candidatus Paceibacterota bacterium]
MKKQASAKKKTSKSAKKSTEKEIYLEGKMDTPAEVAVYYGFKTTTDPIIKKDDIAKAKGLEESDPRKGADGPRFPLEERVAIMRTFAEKNWGAENPPVSIFYRTPLPGEKKSTKAGSKHVSFGLEIMGTTKSIAEALILETVIAILKEEGFENLHIEINSLGNSDSATKFSRELTAYYRKHLGDLSAGCRQAFKDGAFEVLGCNSHDCCLKLTESAPRAVSFLNETDRIHFQEILEFLESTGVSYQINNSLVGNRNFETGTIFEIREDGNDRSKPPLAYGARYEGLARKLGARRDIPSVGISVSYERKNKSAGTNHRIKKPKVFYIQLGFEAKRKSLGVIELLRHAKIPVYQSISRDRLGSQFAAAEKMGVPYIMIMGQKEAVENSVIVRNLANRSQETVPIADLPKYLRKI